MKKVICAFMLAACVFYGCTKESNEKVSINECGVSSWEQLPWAASLTQGKSACNVYDGAKLYQYIYDGKVVFYFNNPASSMYVCNQGVYNCSGSLISQNWQAEQWADFQSERTDEKLLWQK